METYRLKRIVIVLLALVNLFLLGLLLNFDGDKQRFSKSAAQPLPAAPKKEPDPQQNLFRPVRSYEPSPFDRGGQEEVAAHG